MQENQQLQRHLEEMNYFFTHNSKEVIEEELMKERERADFFELECKQLGDSLNEMVRIGNHQTDKIMFLTPFKDSYEKAVAELNRVKLENKTLNQNLPLIEQNYKTSQQRNRDFEKQIEQLQKSSDQVRLQYEKKLRESEIAQVKLEEKIKFQSAQIC